ncbi:MAG: TPM domain-containing protein [Candidatus Woesearchaeota archaeon]
MRNSLLMILLLATSVFAMPQPSGWVNDYANILSLEEKMQLNALIESIEKNTTAEIAIITVKSLEGKPVEEVALNYLTAWGIGKKANNNGVVILVAPTERKYRIEVGYGAEGVITDARAGRIGREILALYFKEGKYGEGLIAAIEEIGGLLKNDPDIVATYSPRYEFFSALAPFMFFFGFVITILISIAASSRATPKQKWTTFMVSDGIFVGTLLFIGYWAAHIAYLVAGIFFLIIGFILFVQIMAGSYRGRSGWIFVGGGHFGRGPGGFGGFGGGTGGGGGASGGW